jgi:hypothetical protein
MNDSQRDRMEPNVVESLPGAEVRVKDGRAAPGKGPPRFLLLAGGLAALAGLYSLSCGATRGPTSRPRTLTSTPT